jgi:hypothetical protein
MAARRGAAGRCRERDSGDPAQRNAIVGMVTTATCLGAGIFVAVVIHIITD